MTRTVLQDGVHPASTAYLLCFQGCFGTGHWTLQEWTTVLTNAIIIRHRKARATSTCT